MNIEKYLDEHENKDLLRLLTCGSVDDGKSTLIGRLLYDSKLIYDDQLSKLKEESETSGNKGDEEFDYALLLDGLKAEREQGITIDVAYRYFSTPARKFIIADTPGHEQYTRNMATGASTADLAIILIDARKGVITQTKRHSFIVSLLGIKHVVVAVNKMDLVDYDEQVFNDIRDSFNEFSADLNLENKYFIPLSALKGDNVVNRSEQCDWYTDLPLLERLEEVSVTSGRNFEDFRFPVQTVIRPNLDFRGFAGTVASGIISVGDAVTSLPSGKTSTVKEIVTADGNLEQAFPPQAVTITLNDEIDVSSGDMLVKSDNIPHQTTRFESYAVWMSEEEVKQGKTYLLRQAGQTVKARVDSINYRVDINTLEKSDSDALGLNEIGSIVISTTKPLLVDNYSKNHETGSYILIDPISNSTVGAGMITNGVVKATAAKDEEDHIGIREFHWESGTVTPEDRKARNNHQPKTVLITGKVGTGKRELAANIEKRLFDLKLQSYYLGISNVQSGLDSDIGGSFLDRDEQIRRLGELSRIMTDAGLIFISTFDGATDYDIDRIRKLNSPNELFVIHLGDDEFESTSVDIALGENEDSDVSVSKVLAKLSVYSIIPEYSI